VRRRGSHPGPEGHWLADRGTKTLGQEPPLAVGTALAFGLALVARPGPVAPRSKAATQGPLPALDLLLLRLWRRSGESRRWHRGSTVRGELGVDLEQVGHRRSETLQRRVPRALHWVIIVSGPA